MFNPATTLPVLPVLDPNAVFEATFKMPSDTIRCGSGYAVTNYNAWDGQAFVRRWEGWIARHRLACAEQDTYRRRLRRLEAALRELVGCKDLKSRIAALEAGEDASSDIQALSAEIRRLRADYAQRKPKAWQAARQVMEDEAIAQSAKEMDQPGNEHKVHQD